MGGGSTTFRDKMKLLIVLLLVGLGAAQNLLSDEFIEKINAQATTWKAGRNFHPDTPMEHLVGLMGAKFAAENPLPVKKAERVENMPAEFDARKQWSNCPSIAEIRDQSSCGSCWAISAAEVMTDRQCISKKETFHYSASDIMSCCDSCGDGCNGGYPYAAMQYWKDTGVVSGGLYQSHQGCKPYPFLKCNHHVQGPLPDCSNYNFNTPACKHKCEDSYNTPYSDDRHYASSAYQVDSDEEQITKELQKNGPVQGAFTVYGDFPNYKSGVYQHVSGQMLGGHAIRILGWGVENGSKYWLVANSWNENWGDHGYFKILKGSDECGIESGIVAGMPK